MALKIVLKKRFLNKLNKLLIYLESEWGHHVAKKFLDKIDKKLEDLSHYPYMGIQSEKVPDVRSILIIRYNRLYYRIAVNTIIVLNLYDTRRNPEKNPYRKR